ncbi:type IV secretion system protein [Cellulomonas sp. P24]|uniref:type IV secretion system protein n=1 Tax=Cellulomonas sp. P24 TaxID=2885206 RepID=UPI00216ACC07|nr:type IV secretion system protein [Cellulomonas sp. P24]MCR6490913.1 type IV secretion system protein [Cellulomonas sp. P24]
MNWSDYLNPFAALGNAAASVVADGWTAAMLGIWNAGLWLLKLALTIEDAFLVPDLSAGGPMRDLYGATFWIAGAVVLLLFLVQLGIAGVRRDGQSVGRVLLGVGQFGAVWVMWIVFAVAILAAAGGLTRALTQSLLGVDSMSAWQPWTGFSTADLTDGTVATVLGVLGIFVVFAAVAHLLVMLARAAALMVLAATNPVSAAGLVWDGGRSWFWKTFRWFLAAAFTPVLMVLMLGLGVKATSGVALSMTDSLQTAIGTAVPGVVLIFVGSFAPLALFKLLAFVDPGTSSGSAMRAGLAAQGGWQGVLNGRADGANTSDAASSSDASGQSGGEADTEAATNDRFARSAGGFLGALGAGGQVLAQGWGMAQGLGSQGAALGADLTNQMGVGHNTYIPDFSGSRSRPGQQGRSRDEDTPDINGSGPDDDAGFGPSPSATGKPPVGGSPTAGAAGGAGGGAAAAPEAAVAAVVV